MKLSLKKQILFSIIPAILAFVSLETATRVHHLYKYGYKSPTKKAIYINQKLAKGIFEDFEKREFEAYPYVMYRTKPNQHYDTFNVNSLGFRGREIQRKKPKGTIRIAMLGGSAMWGTGASSDEGTISAKLEKKVKAAYTSKTFEVINAGDSGYVTAQEFILLWGRVLDLDPDIVITFDGYNDMYAGLINYIAGYPQNFREFKEKLEKHHGLYYLGAVIRELLSHSLFVEKLANKMRIFAFRGTVTFNSEGIPAMYADPSEVARIFGRNLEYVHVISSDHGIETLFTIQPILGYGSKPLTDSEKTTLAALNENVMGYSKYINKVYPLFIQELNQLKEKRGAKVLDLTDAFKDIEDTVFLDGAHFSDEANEIIASRIYEAIEEVL